MWDNVVNLELLERGIDNIGKLNIRCIAEAFDITLFYWECSTRIVKYEKKYYCIIDCRKNPVEQYEEFLHEIAHIIFDEDLEVIKNINYHTYREYKADRLVPMIAIPKFAINHVIDKSVEEVAEKFNITRALAWKRMLYIYNKGVDNYEGSVVRSSVNRRSN